jgi:hypothetical protein
LVFKGGDKVKIILGADRVAKVAGFESHTRGHSIRIKFDDGHEMLVNEEEILLADDPELTRIKDIYQSLQLKGYRHIALIRKTDDSKIYHKAMKSTKEYFKIKSLCAQRSTDKINYQIIKVM